MYKNFSKIFQTMKHKRYTYKLDDKLYDFIASVLFYSPFKADVPSEHRDYSMLSDSFRNGINVFDHNGNYDQTVKLIDDLTETGVVEFEKQLTWCEAHQQNALYYKGGKCVMCHHNILGKTRR